MLANLNLLNVQKVANPSAQNLKEQKISDVSKENNSENFAKVSSETYKAYSGVSFKGKSKNKKNKQKEAENITSTSQNTYDSNANKKSNGYDVAYGAENKYNKLISKSGSKERMSFVNMVDENLISQIDRDYVKANELISKYDSIPDTFKLKIKQHIETLRGKDANVFFEEVSKLIDMILSWDINNHSVLIMDGDKVPQKVVITSNAKYQLWEDCKGKFDVFDLTLNRFNNAAEHRTSGSGQGVKMIASSNKKLRKEYIAELKIQGANSVGLKRLFARVPTVDDIAKYGSVKYVFDVLGKHLG